MRFVILIVVALAMAGGVVFYMQNKGHKNVATIDDSNYTLIAVKDILPGSFIKTGEHFIWQDIPEGKYPKEVSAKFLRKGSFDISELDGAVARRFIAGNEPLDRDFVVTPGEGGFMSAVLYPGMRAISIGVTLVSGNAGFIFPGDKVDLLLTHQVSSVDGDRSYVTETFVQDVRVLAIDQNVNNPDKKAQIAKTVTLEVSPKQAEEVLVAEELGKISLILR
ncbi:MAG: Flp pilus assembly protein CpaB, partial [Alphaproteobacteria bacterium CG11_big_fil_rev_8_21_14_0_20_44_7]